MAQLEGFFAAEDVSSADISLGSPQRGGDSTQNKKFLQTLAKYDILTLIDTEQMNIWYDKFYTSEDGIPFYSPTFYELNALFQELFQTQYENLDHTSLLPYLELKSETNDYVNSCFLALKRIFDYLEIDVMQQSREIDQITQQAFDSILEAASNRSNEYSQMLGKLQGNDLLNYIYEHDITPFYFVNKFNELYPPVAPSSSEQMMVKVYNPLPKQVPIQPPKQPMNYPIMNQAITARKRKTRRAKNRTTRKSNRRTYRRRRN